MSLPSGLIANPSNLVFYGIFTRTSDLVAAGRAFDTIQPAFRTISLTRIRRRANPLKFRMTRGRRVPAVGWVPDEVWEMVKGYLVEEGLAGARAELQEELHCYDCEQSEVETRRGKTPSGRRPKYDVVADAVCEARSALCISRPTSDDRTGSTLPTRTGGRARTSRPRPRCGRSLRGRQGQR